MTRDTSAALADLIAPVAAGAGFDVEEVELRGSGPHRVLRIVVDRDGGVTLDAAAALSRTLSATLDAADDVLGSTPYRLEVTSRGADAPLTEHRHFRRARGRLVRVTTTDGVEQLFRIVSATDEEIIVFDGARGTEPREVPINQIVTARVELEFSPLREEVRAALAAHSSTAGPIDDPKPTTGPLDTHPRKGDRPQ